MTLFTAICESARALSKRDRSLYLAPSPALEGIAVRLDLPPSGIAAETRGL
jgi:hypothetical protein